MSLLPGELRVISRLPLLAPKLLVDVGSARREWTSLAQEACPEAEVQYFDPQSGTPACGARDGKMEFWLFPHCPDRSTGAFTYASKLHSPLVVRKLVPVRRLDTLLEGRTPDFLKIDVEGMSFDVLLGLGELRPEVVQFEWGWAELAEGQHLGKFYQLFQSWGYVMRELDFVGYDNAQDTYYNFLAGKATTLEKLF